MLEYLLNYYVLVNMQKVHSLPCYKQSAFAVCAVNIFVSLHQL